MDWFCDDRSVFTDMKDLLASSMIKLVTNLHGWSFIVRRPQEVNIKAKFLHQPLLTRLLYNSQFYHLKDKLTMNALALN